MLAAFFSSPVPFLPLWQSATPAYGHSESCGLLPEPETPSTSGFVLSARRMGEYLPRPGTQHRATVVASTCLGLARTDRPHTLGRSIITPPVQVWPDRDEWEEAALTKVAAG